MPHKYSRRLFWRKHKDRICRANIETKYYWIAPSPWQCLPKRSKLPADPTSTNGIFTCPSLKAH